MSFVEQRQERLRNILAEEDLDACLISTPANVLYLTGFSGSSSFFILGRDKSLLVSDTRYTVQIAEECPGLDVHIRDATQQPLEALAAALNKLGYQRIGFESNHLTVAQMENLREHLSTIDWKPGNDRVETLRQVKDDHELQQIREAINIAERAFTVLTSLLQPESTEIELSNALHHYIHQAGGSGVAFESIIAVGPRAALPHAPPTKKRVEEGELLLIDWGATGTFYKSDLTRVLDTRRNGSSSVNSDGPCLEEIYQIVRRAQEAAIEKIRPGVKAVEIDTAARSIIADAGYGDYFGHGLGHGFGIDIHELPSLRPRSETILEAGMVFTIEPGIYLPGWGGVRLEDDILVTEDGYEILTTVPKDLTPIFANRL